VADSSTEYVTLAAQALRPRTDSTYIPVEDMTPIEDDGDAPYLDLSASTSPSARK
jgi:hypothetical protein